MRGHEGGARATRVVASEQLRVAVGSISVDAISPASATRAARRCGEAAWGSRLLLERVGRQRRRARRSAVSQLAAICLEGHRLTARLVEVLIEVEARRLDLKAACTSMFDFCVRRLGMSEGAAFRRINAARLVKRFPWLLARVESGAMCLSTLVLLRPHLVHLTEAKADELAAAVAGKTQREVEEHLARIAPRPDAPCSIVELSRVPTQVELGPGGRPAVAPLPPASPAPPRATRLQRARIEPLSESRFKVQLTASAELRDKLERARALMSHRNPSGDLAAVVERALDLLLERLEKQRLGKATRPRRRAATPARAVTPAHGANPACGAPQGLRARRRNVHLRRRRGPPLSFALTPRARPRRIACARRPARRGELARALPRAQPSPRGRGLRKRARRARRRLSATKVPTRHRRKSRGGAGVSRPRSRGGSGAGECRDRRRAAGPREPGIRAVRRAPRPRPRRATTTLTRRGSARAGGAPRGDRSVDLTRTRGDARRRCPLSTSPERFTPPRSRRARRCSNSEQDAALTR